MSSAVPEGWDNIPLQDICFFQEGPGLRNWQYRDSGTKFINIRCIKDGDIDTSIAQHLSNEEVEEKYSHFLLNEGDYVLSSSGTIGRLALVKKHHLPLLLNTSVIRFRSIDETRLDSLYLRHFLLSEQFFDKISEQCQGSAQVNFGPTHLKVIDALLPPFPEQKKIASILTSLDEVIENTQKQIDKLQDLKKATMNELLTKGIGHTEFKDSELGRIPMSWEVSLIGEVCEVGTGKKDTQNKMKYGRYPFFVRSQTIERIDSYSFDGEAILTAGDGVGTGKVFHYVNGRFDFHQRVYKLSDFRGGAIGKFLYYCFSSRFLKQVQQFSARGSVESVRMEMITGMAIPLPSIQEQSKIVDCISAIETNISIGKQKLSQTQSLKKSLMQDLLTGKVRVTV